MPEIWCNFGLTCNDGKKSSTPNDWKISGIWDPRYVYIPYFLFLKVAIDKNGKEISSKPGVYPPFGF